MTTCEAHRTEAEAAAIARAEQSYAEETARRETERIERSGAIRTLTFDAYVPKTRQQQEALEAARSGKSLWLWGYPGVGKTHLASAAVLETQGSLLYPVADLIARLRAGQLDGDAEECIALCRTVSLLALDDLGVERPTPYAIECLYRIVDTRYTSGLRTIVTSNARPSKLAATLGSRIHSRLAGMCEAVHIVGPDGRLT